MLGRLFDVVIAAKAASIVIGRQAMVQAVVEHQSELAAQYSLEVAISIRAPSLYGVAQDREDLRSLPELHLPKIHGQLVPCVSCPAVDGPPAALVRCSHAVCMYVRRARSD